MKSRYLLLLGMLLGTLTQAQIFKPGTLITTEGDTVTGLVAPGGGNTMVYKPDKKGKRDIFKLSELSGYKIDTAEYQLHVVEVIRGNFPEKTKAFLKVVIRGPVTLLEYRGDGIFGKEHVNYYLHHGEEVPYRVNRNGGNFKTTMKIYFRDYEELAQRIRKKELGYENLVEIVNIFNDWYQQEEANTTGDSNG